MKEQLVTFETAELARIKGFNYPTRNHMAWDKDPNMHLDREVVDWNTECKDIGITSIPTQSLLQKWLRDECKIVVIPNIFDRGWLEKFKFCYQCHIYNENLSDDFIDATIDEYPTYEEALEHGLQLALKKLN